MTLKYNELAYRTTLYFINNETILKFHCIEQNKNKTHSKATKRYIDVPIANIQHFDTFFLTYNTKLWKFFPLTLYRLTFPS